MEIREKDNGDFLIAAKNAVFNPGVKRRKMKIKGPVHTFPNILCFLRLTSSLPKKKNEKKTES